MNERQEHPVQLPLDLGMQPRFGREDFLVGPSNEDAYEMIDRWPNWPEHFAMIIGPKGAGKSHLAAIWAASTQALVIHAAELSSQVSNDQTCARAIVIENLDLQPFDEAALFHLFNLLRGNGGFLLITARTGPESWGLTTPDLLSRLRLAPRITISAPDDMLLRALIVKQFLDRQIIVDTSVVEYLMPRIERSFEGVARVVEALDSRALALGRRITRAIAADVLTDMSLREGQDIQ